MKKLYSILFTAAALLFVAGPVIVAGCKTQLSPSGVYAGKQYLYVADRTIADSYDYLNAFVTWEYQNRAAIATNWPTMTKVADNVRALAPQFYHFAIAARSAYAGMLDNTNATVSALNSASNALAKELTSMQTLQAATAQLAAGTTFTNKP